jgi:penicillin V acylase-like amidase (Ntn superfamily)
MAYLILLMKNIKSESHQGGASVRTANHMEIKMKIAGLIFYFLLFPAPSLVSQLSDSSFDLGDRQHCTSFCLDNNGYAVFGTNYDHVKDRYDGLVFVNKRKVSKSFHPPDSSGQHVRWTAKYGSVSFNFIASQTSWTGMNEAGLVISSMRLEGSQSPKPDKRPWILVQYWLQYALDNFSTVEEVIESDSSLRIVGPGRVPHFLVSDKYAHCATIEFLDGKMVAHSGKNLPVKALANTAYDRSISEWQKISRQKKNGEPGPAMGTSSRGRFVRAADRVSMFQPTDTPTAVGIAFDILDDVSVQPTSGLATCWSIVFDTKNLSIHFKTIVHSEIRMIDFQKLDFSCQSPVKMIDINEKLSGDITDQLKDYSFKLHFDHALRACKKYGLAMEPEELMKEIRIIEEFPCESSLKQRMPDLPK